jgi:putative ABC transport system ATP-binding protein
MVLRVEGLAKGFEGAPVFTGVSFTVRRGEFVALLGESGVGKSTLLNCIAGLEPPSAGRVALAGQPLDTLDEPGLARLRREHLGFVFQAFHVLPHLTVVENVALPLRLLGTAAAESARRAHAVLEEVGLEGLGARWPAQLSGGQLQRVAIARAVVHRPALILADEPTGNLDPDTAARVLAVLARQVQGQGSACLLVTHSQAAAARADRVLSLHRDGVAEPAAAAAPATGRPDGG